MGKLHFAPPYHSELQVEEKMQGVRNEKYMMFGMEIWVFGNGGAKCSSPVLIFSLFPSNSYVLGSILFIIPSLPVFCSSLSSAFYSYSCILKID